MKPGLWIERFAFGRDTTGGRMFDVWSSDPIFLSWTLEDEKREEKVYGETCIPVGVYPLELYKAGRMHARYAEKFGDRHKGMLHVMNVPDFEAILIHIGNWAYEGAEAPGGIEKDDTKGCPLVGSKLIMTDQGEFELQSSTPAYWNVYNCAVSRLLNGELGFLTVTER